MPQGTERLGTRNTAPEDLTTILGCHGKRLEQGRHKIVLGFMVVGLGKMSFGFTDTVE